MARKSSKIDLTALGLGLVAVFVAAKFYGGKGGPKALPSGGSATDGTPIPAAFRSFTAKPGERVNISQYAPTITDEDVAMKASASLSARGHLDVQHRQSKTGSFVFNYNSFPMSREFTFKPGQASSLGPHATILIHADKASTSPPAVFANA